MTNANEMSRRKWVEAKLSEVPAGMSLLDVGAGECQYKKFCSHLEYTSQDVALYDGEGNASGLQTGSWDFSEIDIRCDVLDIPEDKQYDAVLCTEVLEHVPDPVAVLEKIVRLVKPHGFIILTAPFTSLTHFAPYHYATGFSAYFYQLHLPRLGCNITELSGNGGYFDLLEQELGRAPSVYKKYFGKKMGFLQRKMIKFAQKAVRRAKEEDGSSLPQRSAELATLGWHVVARKQPPK